jgi:Tfp pilus assembly protein PilO
VAADKRTLALTVGGIVLATGLGVTGTVFTLKEIRREEEAIAARRADIARARTKVAATSDLERDVVISRETVDVLSRILPDEKAINEFVAHLRDFQEESEVKIFTLDDVTPRREDTTSFRKVAYRLQIEANFWQLLSFLSRLESYQRFVRVPQLRLTAGKRPDDGDYEKVRHTVRLEAETFVYNPGKTAERVEIAHYDRRREQLSAEIARALDLIEEPPYRYQGDRGRRDPLVDPRLSLANEERGGLPLDQQAALVDRLLQAVQAVVKQVDQFEATGDILARAEMRREIDLRFVALTQEILAAERTGKVNYLPLLRRFRREVKGAVEEARLRFEGIVAEHPTVEELRIVAEDMRSLLADGDLTGALERYSLVESRLRAAKSDPKRAPLVVAIEALERRARLAEEFSRRKIEIAGVVVGGIGSVAVINGQTVTEGDALDDDLVVRRIGVDEIEFQYQDLVIAKKR